MSSEPVDHHKQREYCRTRLAYRNGRQPRAVKVYTISNESQHLLIFGVPRINLQVELSRRLVLCGPVKSLQKVSESIAKKIELEPFTDVYHVRFHKIEGARRAKRILDAQEFYGGILHISYAPEYETLDEVREKFAKRRQEVRYRMRVNNKKPV